MSCPGYIRCLPRHLWSLKGLHISLFTLPLLTIPSRQTQGETEVKFQIEPATELLTVSCALTDQDPLVEGTHKERKKEITYGAHAFLRLVFLLYGIHMLILLSFILYHTTRCLFDIYRIQQTKNYFHNCLRSGPLIYSVHYFAI